MTDSNTSIGNAGILTVIKQLDKKIDEKFKSQETATESQFSDIRVAINGLDKKIDEKFDGLDRKIDQNFIDLHTAMSDYATHTDEQLTTITSKLSGATTDISGIKQRLTKVESSMVTKEYLDDKLANQSGNTVVMLRKEDSKVNKLMDVLKDQEMIGEKDIRKITALGPFVKSL